MISEGNGCKAPAVREVRVGNGELIALLHEADRRAEFRGYKSKPTTWQRGLLSMSGSLELSGVGRVEASVRPIFIGLIGEYAVGSLVGIPIDYVLRDKGDKGIDLEDCGLTVQVKSVSKVANANLVRVRKSNGVPTPIVARTLAFCHVEDVRCACVRGWLWTHEANQLPEVSARVGDHFNIEVPSEWLYPISALKDEFEARRSFKRGNH